jgi:hypothetical protein
MAMGLVAGFLVMGCAAPLSITLHQVSRDKACIVPEPEGDLLVGVALSGGGSRAALFGEAGLEALAKLRAPGGGSVLERLAEIPTRFYVASECDRQLLAAAAAKVVAQHRQEIVEMFQ